MDNKMSQNIIYAHDLDINAISFGKPRSINSGSGARTVNVKYNGHKLIIQTPSMKLPYGISTAFNSDTDNPKYVLDLCLGSAPAVQARLEELDRLMVTRGTMNSRDWLKEDNLPEDFVDRMYTNTVRYSKDEAGKRNDKYPPKLRVKVPFRDSRFQIPIYDEERKEIEQIAADTYTDLLCKGSHVECLISCLGVWLVNGKFGLTWKVEQLMYNDNPEILKGFAFKDKTMPLANLRPESENDEVDNELVA